MRIAVALLAAGGSSRLGAPKQLVLHGGRSLLRRAAEAACRSVADHVLVVLGHEAARMREELQGLRTEVAVNRDWKSGLSSSIKVALASLPPDVDALLLMVCDQPAVTTRHLDALIGALASTASAPVASAYGGTVGVPALFPRDLFGELASLTGDAGAKRILEAHFPDTRRIPLPGGEVDIDAEGDASGVS